VGVMLILTGALLLIADRATDTTGEVSYAKALMIGIAQAVAILPGISRSGATISTSVLLGIDRTRAASFSFLMVVPLIIAKIAKDLSDGALVFEGESMGIMATGFLAAFITGLIACSWMIRLVKNAQLKYFSYYCFIVGTGACLYQILG